MRKHALLSVYDKAGIVEFAQRLTELGFDLLASGGTAKALAAADIPVMDISVLVGEPILGHRVVTLSREIFAGLLATRSPEDLAELDRIKVPFIDLVCVDLYPLKAEIDDPLSTIESVTEKTDIGGPAMLRAAAKGRRIVIPSVLYRETVIDWLEAGMPNEEKFLLELAAEAEAVAGHYATVSAHYLRSTAESLTA